MSGRYLYCSAAERINPFPTALATSCGLPYSKKTTKIGIAFAMPIFPLTFCGHLKVITILIAPTINNAAPIKVKKFIHFDKHASPLIKT